MTVLTACQTAALRLAGRKRTAMASVFASTGQLENELADLATEVAVDIMKAHDWQALRTLATYPGDGATAAFDLPADYDRQVKDAKVHSSAWQNATYYRAKDDNEWIYLQDVNVAGNPGAYTILGGQMLFQPAPAAGETARYYYISKYIAAGKAAFTTDNDVFRLNERVLTLGIIWRWRAQKGTEYAEDLQNYEVALSYEISRDKGARILVEGPQRVPGNVSNPYPGTLG